MIDLEAPEITEAAQRVSLPRWMAPVASAAVGALVAGAVGGVVGWAAFQSNNGYNSHATIAGNQAEIVALQERVRSVDTQLGNLPTQYVSQPSFAEFKTRYDKDQSVAHDFQMRIDTKMDILLSEHGPKNP